jgi:hypothetical protein
MRQLKLFPATLKKLTLLFVICISQIKAQKSAYNTNYHYEREEINYSIYSNQIDKSINLLRSFFEVNKIQLTTYSQNNGSYEYKFSINETLVNSLDSLVNRLGFRASKSIKNDSKKGNSVIELSTNIEHLKEKKTGYENLLAKIDSVNGKDYLFYFEKIVALNDDMFQQTLLLKEAQIRQKTQVVEINLHDDYATSDYSNVMFVHMPGAEYNIMFIENPTPGISATQYQGYSLKYLFTRGKSYFSIGALKPVMPLAKSDSSIVKDIFSLTFGQDFYNRHLGRGKRKFLNLYIGYQAGISNARNFNSDKVFAMVAPVTGLELFKNKYFNLDVNGSYFIPLNDFSYTLRGIKVNASLNFSF